jgi:hypothetical protein
MSELKNQYVIEGKDGSLRDAKTGRYLRAPTHTLWNSVTATAMIQKRWKMHRESQAGKINPNFSDGSGKGH